MKVLFLFSFVLVLHLNAAPSKVIASAYKNKIVKKPVIILDAGHGGLDKGAKIKYPYIEEKRITLKAALLSKQKLERLGYKVILTREKDYFVPLKKRVDIANSAQAELFISIHFNSCPNKIAQGIEIYYHNSQENKIKAKNSKNLAHCILVDLVKNTQFRSRGVKKGQFCVVKDTKMPAILIEGGFLTNPQERDIIRKPAYLEKISLAIVDGIENFIKKYI